MFKGSFLHQNPSEPGSSHTDDKARLEAVLRGELNQECLVLVATVATKSKMFQWTRFRERILKFRPFSMSIKQLHYELEISIA